MKKERRKYNVAFGALAIAGIAWYDLDLFHTLVEDVEYKHDFQLPQGSWIRRM